MRPQNRLPALALLLAACGSAPSRPEPAAGPAPLDLSAALPPDAPVTATFLLPAVARLFDELGRRAPPLQQALSQGGLSVLRDEAMARAFGLDAEQPLWFSLRAGPAEAVNRAADAVEQAVKSGDEHALGAWLQRGELPPAWLHLRVVGLPLPVTMDTLTLLQERFGAIQAWGPGDPPEALGAALGVEADAARDLAPLIGDARLYRLLDADLASVLLLRIEAERVVVDLLQDQDLGEGALPAALTALAAPRAGETHQVIGPPSQHEVLRLHLDHAGWLLFARTLGEAAALQLVLTREAILADRARLVEAGRQAARRPEALMARSGGVFGASVVRVEHQDAEVRFGISALYTPRGTGLAKLTGGEAPAPHEALAGIAPIAFTFAGRDGWGEHVRALAPPPDVGADELLAAVSQCGFVCYPALWSALPAFGGRLAGTLRQIFVDFEDFGSGLEQVTGASIGIDGSAAARSFAAALRFGGTPREEVRAAWSRLLGDMPVRWKAVDDDLTLVAGSDPGVVERLSAAVAPAPVEPVVQFSARFLPQSPFAGLELTLAFADDAMELAGAVLMRPAAEPAPAP